jgi:hypothetical protein
MDAEIRPKLGTWKSVSEAIHQYAHADDDRRYRAARERVQRAATAWVKSRGR